MKKTNVNPIILDARQRAAAAYAESHRVLADHRAARAEARAQSRRILEETRALRREADAVRRVRLLLDPISTALNGEARR